MSGDGRRRKRRVRLGRWFRLPAVKARQVPSLRWRSARGRETAWHRWICGSPRTPNIGRRGSRMLREDLISRPHAMRKINCLTFETPFVSCLSYAPRTRPRPNPLQMEEGAKRRHSLRCRPHRCGWRGLPDVRSRSPAAQISPRFVCELFGVRPLLGRIQIDGDDVRLSSSGVTFQREFLS